MTLAYKTMAEDKVEYEVEAVLEKRVRRNAIEYLVKWAGWPHSDNTWETEEHLANCKDFVEDFESRQKTEKYVEAVKRCEEAVKRFEKAENDLAKAKEAAKKPLRRLEEADKRAMEAFDDLFEAQQILVEVNKAY